MSSFYNCYLMLPKARVPEQGTFFCPCVVLNDKSDYRTSFGRFLSLSLNTPERGW